MTKQEQIEKLTAVVQRELTKNISNITPSWVYDLGATEIAKALVEEENVVVLPCNIGDKFWRISGLNFASIIEEKVFAIRVENSGFVIYGDDGTMWLLDEIYFTREEAEKALEKMKKC